LPRRDHDRIPQQGSQGRQAGVFGSFRRSLAACRLALSHTRPNLWCICGPSAAVNSSLPKLMWSVSDNRMHEGAEGRITLDGVMDMQGNPTFIDFGFTADSRSTNTAI
jgi:hypothetical protein